MRRPPWPPVDSTELHGVLSDKNRRRILDLIADGERTVSDLIRATRLHQPLVSHHLRVLRQAGLVSTRKEGRFRFYRAASRGVLGGLKRLEEDAVALLEEAERSLEGAAPVAAAKPAPVAALRARARKP